MASGSVRDVDAHTFVQAYAAHLKRSGKLQVPEWTDIVKTGISKELSPSDPNWFYLRVASLARHVYLRPGLGVGAFRTTYGCLKNRGSRPSHHKKASGSVIRKGLQALEKLNLLAKDGQGGRSITSEGRKDLDRVAMHCLSR